MRLLALSAVILGTVHFLPITLADEEPMVPTEIFYSLRTVEDPDGYTNIRSGPSIKDKVVGTVPSGSVVAIEGGPEKEWVKLAFDTDNEAAKYIHGSRLKKLETWKRVGPKLDKPNAAGSVAQDGFEARVKSLPFVAANHKITKTEHGTYNVDGSYAKGTDGTLPKESLSLEVSLNGKAVEIPKAAFTDLYEPNLGSLALLTPANAADHAVVLMTNGDGAGGYCVAWAFQKGRYLGRVVFVPF